MELSLILVKISQGIPLKFHFKFDVDYEAAPRNLSFNRRILVLSLDISKF